MCSVLVDTRLINYLIHLLCSFGRTRKISKTKLSYLRESTMRKWRPNWPMCNLGMRANLGKAKFLLTYVRRNPGKSSFLETSNTKKEKAYEFRIGFLENFDVIISMVQTFMKIARPLLSTRNRITFAEIVK